MKFPIVHINKLPAAGMALFPFVLVKKIEYKVNKTLITHEKIHLRQQLELLIFVFYILYLLHYVINLLKYTNHEKAYMNIVFEREAYSNENNEGYLKGRSFWAWLKYL